MSATISVDIDALYTLLIWVKQVRDTLDNQKSLMPSLSDQLDAAITGKAPQISNFETTFKGWTHQLNILTTDMDQAYIALKAVHDDMLAAVNAL